MVECDEVSFALLAFDCYRRMKKSGKPKSDEWTHFAAIVQCSSTDNICSHECVSLGTGSKCLSHDRLSEAGNLVNDSHAEVLARRGFMQYLYGELHSLLASKQSIFWWNSGVVELKHNIKFYMFTSQTPCGSMSIHGSNERSDFPNAAKRRKIESEDELFLRTGAKCCPGEEQDGNYEDPQNAGVLRTKPGRGERTLSLSCSDKVLRWQVLGLQGTLLSYFIKDPICLSGLIVGKCPRNLVAVDRAINHRGTSILKEKISVKGIDLCFEHSPSPSRIKPSASSIVWWLRGKQEVLVGGSKQGMTKKDSHLPRTWPAVCKYNFLQLFSDTIILWHRESCNNSMFRTLQISDVGLQTYDFFKSNCANYQKKREQFLSIFPNWIVTPRKYYQFSVQQNKDS